jgi:predicted outer membrane protein
MSKGTPLVLAAALVALTCAAAMAENQNKQKEKLSKADQLFLESLAQSNEADLEISRFVENNSKNPQVKHFAGVVASEDQMIQSDVNNLANAGELRLPSSLDKADAHLKADLEKMAGDEALLDHAYMQAMVDKFHSTRDSFLMESAATENPSVRKFTDQNVPNLEATLEQALNVSMALPPVTTANKQPEPTANHTSQH